MAELLKFLILFILVKLSSGSIFLDEPPTTGYITITRGKLFYWLFDPRNGNLSAPVLLWLSGGPGSSSSIALFAENGPFIINKNLTLSKNAFSWNQKAFLLFIDQPVGTGYSTAKNYVVNEQQIAEDMFEFLKGFYKKYTHLKCNKLYMAGESYAGHYLPAITKHILKANDLSIKVEGIAIGNGLVSAYHQYPTYPAFAYSHGKITLCKGLLHINIWPLAMIVCQMNMFFISGTPYTPRFNRYDITKKM